MTLSFEQIALELIVRTFELYDRKLIAFALRDEDVQPDPEGTLYKVGPNTYEKVMDMDKGRLRVTMDPAKRVRVVTTADERIVAYCLRRAQVVHRMLSEHAVRGLGGGRAPGGDCEIVPQGTPP